MRVNVENLKIQKTIKHLMKENKISYAKMAHELKLSEVTIKRWLNSDDISIGQLNSFAKVLGVSFYELIELAKNEKREVYQFSKVQEKVLAKNLNYIKTFRFVLIGESFNKIMKNLSLTESALRKIIRELEEVELVELRKNDLLVPLVFFPFKWQENGDLFKAYNRLILENIFNRISKNKSDGLLNTRFEFVLSEEIYQKFCQEIDLIKTKYQTLSETHIENYHPQNSFVTGLFFIDQFSVWDF